MGSSAHRPVQKMGRRQVRISPEEPLGAAAGRDCPDRNSAVGAAKSPDRQRAVKSWPPDRRAVYGPGGYRFGDLVRIGVPLDLLAMGVTVTLTPLIFSF